MKYLRFPITWAIGWAIVGLMIGVTSLLLPGLPWWDSFYAFYDAPLPALAMPGFIGGAVFSIMLALAGRRRPVKSLSPLQYAGLGAIAGVIVSLIPATMVGVGLAHLGKAGMGLARITAIISVPLIVMSVGSAFGSKILVNRSRLFR